jgi:hypothetical protein
MRLAVVLIVAFAIVTSIPACGSRPPGAPGDQAGDRVHQQAATVLARWAAAVADAGPGAPVFVGELTGQVGDWEEPVGDNNKIALMSGQIQAVADLPGGGNTAGEIRWADGTATHVRLLSATQALEEIAASADPACDCRPLNVTAAALATMDVQTSRGPAAVPVWNFTIDGTAVHVTYVAVASRVSVPPLPWDPALSSRALRIDSANGDPTSRDLTVTFTGAPDPGSQACGADYTAEAIESDVAIVVIVVEHRNAVSVSCAAVGARRTAVATLAAPLADRTVLDVEEGLPVAVTPP